MKGYIIALIALISLTSLIAVVMIIRLFTSTEGFKPFGNSISDGVPGSIDNKGYFDTDKKWGHKGLKNVRSNLAHVGHGVPIYSDQRQPGQILYLPFDQS
uniref:Uncharacterized protein n=1 Tax=viral metagenome TaxID=1070528 RepID=A0A6C0J5D2_9ZZZZ